MFSVPPAGPISADTRRSLSRGCWRLRTSTVSSRRELWLLVLLEKSARSVRASGLVGEPLSWQAQRPPMQQAEIIAMRLKLIVGPLRPSWFTQARNRQDRVPIPKRHRRYDLASWRQAA